MYRSTDLDKWTAEQIKAMTVGGNEAARQFFKDKGYDTMGTEVSSRIPTSN